MGNRATKPASAGALSEPSGTVLKRDAVRDRAAEGPLRQAFDVLDRQGGALPGPVRRVIDHLTGEVQRLQVELQKERERTEALRSEADEDPLVPVLNRRAFMRELERGLSYRSRYGGALSLVFIDVDGFKQINDLYGHGIGDDVLRQVGDMLVENVRRSDLVGRLGGDEFAIALMQADAGQARFKAGQLAGQIAARPQSSPASAPIISISTGVAQARDEDSAASLLERADAAMFADKASKRRHVRKA